MKISDRKIIGVDVGTTALKACLFDSECQLIEIVEKSASCFF